MVTSHEELDNENSQLCERLNHLMVARNEAIKTVERYADDITYYFEEIQGLLECNSDLITLREKLREELNNLEPNVEKYRELKAKLQAEKRTKSQLVTDLKQEFEDLQVEVEELESKLRNENNQTPIILRLMKSHKPGPDNNNK